MVSKERAIEIVKQFIDDILPNEGWYKAVQPYIVAILLYGSVAKGTNKPDSDIDILVILPLEMEEKYTTGEYFYNYQEQKINIVLRSIERLRKIAEEHKNETQKEVFRGSAIIKSDKEVLTLLRQIDSI